MTHIKLAVIGAGHLGRIHARLLSNMPGVELIGIADPLAAVRETVASECNTAPFADHRPLVGAVDGAIIATPTRNHHAVAVDFIRQATPVLVEKPLASDLGEADDLLRASRVHGTLVQVGHIERFNPAFMAAAAHVSHPRYIEAVRASTFTGRSVDIGVVYDLMIHDIDLVLALANSPVKSVSAIGVALLGAHEDVAQARLEFENGLVANLSASRASFAPAPRRQMQIWSEGGFANIDFGNRSAHVVHPCDAVLERRFDYRAQTPDQKAAFKDRLFTEILPVEQLQVEMRNALSDELHEFVASIRDHQSVRVTVEAGRDAVMVAEKILDSIRAHTWHGHGGGPTGPLASPEPSILRGPHWQGSPDPRPLRREAGVSGRG